MGGIPAVIPLFPLPNIVLFPQTLVPLHIFEPRYKKMVADALEGHRTIGMTLLRPGWESDYQGRPPIYDPGCAGVIQQCEELAHGRFNIVLKGVSRFRVLEEHAGEPYRLATVAVLPEGMGDVDALDTARRDVLAAIGRATDGPAALVLQSELPHDIFINGLCQSLALDPVERQSLLDCNSVLDRYRRLLEILDFRLLEHTYRRGGGPKVH